jgi:hypothetical protein
MIFFVLGKCINMAEGAFVGQKRNGDNLAGLLAMGKPKTIHYKV